MDSNYLILDDSTRLYYYVFVFALYFMLIHMHRKKIFSYYRGIPKKVWLKLALITLAGLIIRAALCPMRTITGVTVWSHLLEAINISESQIIDQISHSRGYSLLLSPIYTITRDIVFSAHFFDIVIGSLSIIAIFLLAYILFKDTDTALISALILCLLPWHIFFSATYGVEVTGLFFVMLSFIMIWISSSEESREIYFLALISVLATVLIKKELSITILIFIAFSAYPRLKSGRHNISDSISIILGLILFIPYVLDIMTMNFYDGQFSQDNFSKSIFTILEHFGYNFYLISFLLLTFFIFWRERHILKDFRKEILFLSLWFLVSIMPYLLHHQVRTRYFIFYASPMIILISFSISRLMYSQYRRPLILFMSLNLLFSSLFVLSQCSGIDSSCTYVYAQPLRETDIRLSEIRTLLNTTPKDSYIFPDGQTPKAFYSMNRDLKNMLVYEVESFKEFPEDYRMLDEYCYPGGDNVSYLDNIYLIDFDFPGYDDREEYEEFLYILDTYPNKLLHTGDIYKIYRITKGTQEKNQTISKMIE